MTICARASMAMSACHPLRAERDVSSGWHADLAGGSQPSCAEIPQRLGACLNFCPVAEHDDAAIRGGPPSQAGGVIEREGFGICWSGATMDDDANAAPALKSERDPVIPRERKAGSIPFDALRQATMGAGNDRPKRVDYAQRSFIEGTTKLLNR